jgi:hypothetical protein
MLFKTNKEFITYEAASSGLAFDDIAPYIQKVELKILRAAISPEQYKNLDDAYNASASPVLSDQQKALLEYCRQVIAPLALAMYSYIGQMNISSQGFQIVSTETNKQAFQWQMVELRKQLRSRGFEYLDLLLAFMEQAPEVDYALWRASTAYTVFKKNILQTALEFSEYYNIRGSRYMFQQFQPFINQAEEGLIKNTLLPGLYNLIKAEILANDLSVPNARLVELLKPALAGLALAKGLLQISVSITEDGITVFNNEASQTVDTAVAANAAAVSALRIEAEKDGKAALEVAYSYILKNLADFPTHTSDPAYNAEATSHTPHFKSSNGSVAFL